jgi:hypothetical protein
MSKFLPGNTFSRKARGIPKRPKIAGMLEQFAPDVIQVVRDMLNSKNTQERWTAAKEVMPYLWGKRSTVQVGPQEKDPGSLSDYIAARPPADPVPSPPAEGEGDMAA